MRNPIKRVVKRINKATKKRKTHKAGIELSTVQEFLRDERKGVKEYRAAASVTTGHLRQVFTQMARDEANHAERLQAILEAW